MASTPPMPPFSEYTPERSSMSPITTSLLAATAGGPPMLSASTRHVVHRRSFVIALTQVLEWRWAEQTIVEPGQLRRYLELLTDEYIVIFPSTAVAVWSL